MPTRIPILDLTDCTRCMACIEVCPEVFSDNPAGFIEVADLDEYPVECVDEAAAMCPSDCIGWEGEDR